MATEHHDHDERIAAAIRAMADEDGRLTSPPATLWGRIERAIDDPADAAGDLVAPPDELWDHIADDIRADGGTLVAVARATRRRHRIVGLVAAAVLVICGLVAATLVVGRDAGGPSSELIAQAVLTGEGLDPGGDGVGAAELVKDDGTWKVEIEADRLPDLPEGSYYEAWLLGSGDGQVQSLGTLEGANRFAVPDGVTIDDYPVVDVSIEPIDGDPGHSAKSVLRGELETV